MIRKYVAVLALESSGEASGELNRYSSSVPRTDTDMKPCRWWESRGGVPCGNASIWSPPKLKWGIVGKPPRVLGVLRRRVSWESERMRSFRPLNECRSIAQ